MMHYFFIANQQILTIKITLIYNKRKKQPLTIEIKQLLKEHLNETYKSK